MKHVVAIGGGTGTFTLLSALRDLPYEISALLTMVDDGGSNRVLRDEFGLLPTSGVRQALVALSSKPSLLRELFLYRFHQGSGIKGMTFGNLFLAAV
ncbi:MAG TPA: 2-phospho-L-lactate transferase CofD family protein, partial [Candidatus Levybacteria bacterium]|nr:2-phospho-L-lactate transferase CofD family protein [Candidatus Levybacteria bacterium]